MKKYIIFFLFLLVLPITFSDVYLNDYVEFGNKSSSFADFNNVTWNIGFCSNVDDFWIDVKFNETIRNPTKINVTFRNWRSYYTPDYFNVTVWDLDNQEWVELYFEDQGYGGTGCTPASYTSDVDLLTNDVNFNLVRFTVSAESQSDVCGCALNYRIGIDSIDFYAESILNEGNNSFPVFNLMEDPDYYCYNTTTGQLSIHFNITDSEEDDIYYAYGYPSYYREVTRFDEGYDDIIEEGWMIPEEDCNWTIDYDGIKFYTSCSNIDISKNIYFKDLNGTSEIGFQFWGYYNSSSEICLKNNYNENLSCVRIEKYPRENYNLYSTNFSFSDGTNYEHVYESYHVSYFTLKYFLNESHVITSIFNNVNGVNLEYEDTRGLFGVTNNLSRFMNIFYVNNYVWSTVEPYILIDNLYVRYNPIINWILYDNDVFTNISVLPYKSYDFEVVYTDNVNTPDFRFFNKNYYIGEDCYINTSELIDFTDDFTDTFIDIPRTFISSIDNGESIFNVVFYIFLALGLLFCFITFQNLALSFIVTGLIFVFSALYFTGDIFQVVTSGVLISFGVGMIVSESI